MTDERIRPGRMPAQCNAPTDPGQDPNPGAADARRRSDPASQPATATEWRHKLPEMRPARPAEALRSQASAGLPTTATARQPPSTQNLPRGSDRRTGRAARRGGEGRRRSRPSSRSCSRRRRRRSRTTRKDKYEDAVEAVDRSRTARSPTLIASWSAPCRAGAA